MDYDKTNIAVGYDRGRQHGPENIKLWMDAVSSHVKSETIKTILDLGCGTGRFSQALADRFHAKVIGVDPSRKMLGQARNKVRDSSVRYVAGRGEAIPLPDDSVDLVFMSMIFHHLENPALAAVECRRVLPADGTAFLRAGTKEHISSYPYLNFFPQSRPILEEVLAGGDSVVAAFTSAGFCEVKVDVITQEIAPSWAVYAEKLAAGGDSVLARLSPSDFQSGMDALRLHANRNRSEAVYEPIDVFVFR
jgi:ubiquinone/menaquinone biosynthesis C-methylase UbiE